MNWKMLLAMLLLLLVVPASAYAFDPATHSRCVAGSAKAASVTGLTVQYSGACANYSWNAVSDADFNRFAIQTTSSAIALNGMDFNTREHAWSFCTLPPGTWINAVVYRIDGNANGFCLNVQPDANVTLNPGSANQAIDYLLFNIFVTIAEIFAIMVLVVVVTLVLMKLGLKGLLSRKK